MDDKKPLASEDGYNPLSTIKSKIAASSSTKKVRSGSAPSPMARLLPLLLLVIFLSGGAGYIGGYAASKNNQLNTTGNAAKQQIINSESDLFNSIAKDVGESVVSINVTSSATRQSFFFGPQSYQQQSAGTGVIINTDGVIITNRHVIPAGAPDVSVTLSDGTTLDDVEVLGRTSDSDSLDVAFLKIKDKKGKTIKPAKLGDSSKVEVGDKVLAIGNALGQFQNTVTSGIISGYGRSIEAGSEEGSESLQNLFQTDTAINQGNSGGPLVNVNGEVIGINTAVAGGSAENIGFAIPINDIQGLITSVLKSGKLERPYLGVRYITLNDDLAYQYNLSTKRGAYIAPSPGGGNPILKDSPADKAGLKEKDIITKVNDQSIDEKNSLVSVLGKHAVGEKVTLTIVRDGNEQKVEATLEAAPNN